MISWLYSHPMPMPHAASRPYGVPAVYYCHIVQCVPVVSFHGCTLILCQCHMLPAAPLVCQVYITCMKCNASRFLPVMCRSSQCRGFCLPDVEIHSVLLVAVFACWSFGNHNVLLVAMPRFFPARVLVSNHYVPLVTMPRFLPARVLVITVCRLWQFLSAKVLVITMCRLWQC